MWGPKYRVFTLGKFYIKRKEKLKNRTLRNPFNKNTKKKRSVMNWFYNPIITKF